MMWRRCRIEADSGDSAHAARSIYRTTSDSFVEGLPIQERRQVLGESTTRVTRATSRSSGSQLRTLLSWGLLISIHSV